MRVLPTSGGGTKNLLDWLGPTLEKRCKYGPVRVSQPWTLNYGRKRILPSASGGKKDELGQAFAWGEEEKDRKPHRLEKGTVGAVPRDATAAVKS